MDHSIKDLSLTSQYVQQFNRAVLNYEMFIREKRKKSKKPVAKKQEDTKQ